MNKKKIKLVLLGLDFASPNFGCSALGYSFLHILEEISKNNNIYFELFSVNYNKFEKENRDFYSVYDLQVHYKSLKFYKKFIHAIKRADFVIDFSGGDSFTDIYGVSRFIKESLLKQIAIIFRKKLILGPQTIGPFNNRCIKKWASMIIKKSYRVYVRDNLSQKYAEQMGRKVICTTDIAFTLKPENVNYTLAKSNKRKIGFNISALMLNDGYSSTSLGLKLDYKRFCDEIIRKLQSCGYEIYLIAHVLANDDIENDYALCRKIHREFPETILGPKFKSPMEAKAYMAYMDCVIGSRMHAMIGAFSMGVPIIAVSYSRKFQGLFNSIDYPYVIDAKKMSYSEAIEKIMYWLNDYEMLNKCVVNGLVVVNKINLKFVTELGKLLVE